MRECRGMKGGVVFWAWGEVSREKTDYEHEYEHEQEHEEGEEEEGGRRKEEENIERRTSNVEACLALSVLSYRGNRGSSGKKSLPREAEPFTRAKLF
jgi:hypothetical protein